ncbi:hypothetical protein D3C80_1298990 [compost metagenome]
MTLVGPGSAADATVYTENQGIKFRRGTKGQVSNVVLSGWKTGIDVENDETIAFVPSALKVTNVLYVADVPTKTKGKKTDGTAADVAAVSVESATATGAGAGVAQPTWAAGWTVGF